jgi:hypothetical protein
VRGPGFNLAVPYCCRRKVVRHECRDLEISKRSRLVYLWPRAASRCSEAAVNTLKSSSVRAGIAFLVFFSLALLARVPRVCPLAYAQEGEATAAGGDAPDSPGDAANPPQDVANPSQDAEGQGKDAAAPPSDAPDAADSAAQAGEDQQ